MRFLAPLITLIVVCACLSSSAGAVQRRVAPAAMAARSGVCDKFASTGGSDGRGHGTLRYPYRTLTRLDRSLSPGQTGCLLGGTYGGVSTWQQIDANGTRSSRITVRAYPGEAVTVAGWVDIEGSYTTLEHVRIDGANTLYPQHPARVHCRNHVSQPLVIAGSNDILQYVDYFQSVRSLRGTGLAVGFWGDDENTIIRHDKIHDVGGCDFYDHMIYLAGGSGAQIYDNWMWNDPHGWGVKLDPGPSGARIWGNVIDRAGSGFNFGNSSGARPTADNKVFDNIVVNSVGVSNPEISWSHRGVLVTSSGMLGSSTGNEVFDNDSYNDPGGIGDVSKSVSPAQLRVADNASVAPRFADEANHDFRLLAGSTRFH